MVKDRSEIVKREDSSNEYEKYNEEPLSKLRKLNLSKDFETLKDSPINQPIVEFLEAVERIMEDINYDNKNEMTNLINEFEELKKKDYYKELKISQVFNRMQIIYKRQIYKLMEFPDIAAKAIYEIRRIHEKTK